MFARYFQPENAVLTPIRLRSVYPTVERRAPDTALPSQVVRLAADVKRILERAERVAVDVTPASVDEAGVHRHRIAIPPFEDLQELSNRATRDGLGSQAVCGYPRAMSFDLSRYDPISARIVGATTDEPTTIDEATARQVRLAYAQALREDVDRL